MNSRQAINLLKDLEQSLDDYCELNDEGKAAFRMAITALELFGNSEQLSSAQPEQQHGRVFKGIVVEYPEYCIYPEYKGKPYFSIKYTENGQEFIGYSTYKLEVLSEYLKEYFMPSAQPERKKGKWQITDAYPHNVYCSECHTRFAQTHWSVWEDGSLPRNFCPNCGADMREEDT